MSIGQTVRSAKYHDLPETGLFITEDMGDANNPLKNSPIPMMQADTMFNPHTTTHFLHTKLWKVLKTQIFVWVKLLILSVTQTLLGNNPSEKALNVQINPLVCVELN